MSGGDDNAELDEAVRLARSLVGHTITAAAIDTSRDASVGPESITLTLGDGRKVSFIGWGHDWWGLNITVACQRCGHDHDRHPGGIPRGEDPEGCIEVVDWTPPYPRCGCPLTTTEVTHAAPVRGSCTDHQPVQHRDGRPPWCPRCGLTADYKEPHGRFDAKPSGVPE